MEKKLLKKSLQNKQPSKAELTYEQAIRLVISLIVFQVRLALPQTVEQALAKLSKNKLKLVLEHHENIVIDDVYNAVKHYGYQLSKWVMEVPENDIVLDTEIRDYLIMQYPNYALRDSVLKFIIMLENTWGISPIKEFKAAEQYHPLKGYEAFTEEEWGLIEGFVETLL